MPDTDPLHPDVHVQLADEDGNAVAIITRVRKALMRAGHFDDAKAFTDEATSGDYDHLLRTAMRYVSTS